MAEAIETPERVRSYISRRTELGRPQYRGATYYAQPAIKASPWTWRVPAYVFIAGLAGAAQILATLARFGGGWRRQSTIVRNGRLIGFAGSVAGPLLLIFDLKTPARFYNMLRIFRATSPLSFGSYVLTLFGMLSAATAAAEIAPAGTRAGRALRRAGDRAQVPAALAGAGMATYTGALLAATSVPLWAAAPRLVSARFAASSMAAGAAALSLTERLGGDRHGDSRALDRIAFVSSVIGLALSRAADHAYEREHVGAPLQNTLPGTAYKVGAIAVGQALPLALYGANALRRRPSPALSVAAGLAVLAGSAVFRQAFMRAEEASAERPEDYFGFAQSDRLEVKASFPPEALPQPAPPRSRTSEITG